jgi:hypothetical protein
MVTYKCPICMKIFKKKSNYIRHHERKYSCEKIKIYKCVYCGLISTSNGNRHKHFRICKKKEEYDAHIKMRNEYFEGYIEKIESQLKEKDTENNKLKNILFKSTNIIPMPSVINSNVSNSNNRNNYYDNRVLNITINAFGKEDLTYLKSRKIDKLLARPKVAVEEMTKEIHCNDEHPENTNAYISNKRDKYIVIYNGQSWEHHDRRTVVDKAIDQSFDVLETRYDEIFNKYNRDVEKLSPAIRRFEILRDWYDDLTPEWDALHSKVDMVFYNNRNRTKKLRKIIKA